MTITIALATLLLPLSLIVLYVLRDKEKWVLNEKIRNQLPGNFIKISHGTVHYKIEKSTRFKTEESERQKKPTIILVSGFSAASFVWDANIKALANAGFNVVSFDFYGRGLSDRPHGDYSLEFLVQQLKELLDALEIHEAVNLTGLAMGAAVVTQFTNLYPQRVEKIILLDPLITVPNKPALKILKVPFLGKLLSKIILVPKIKIEALKYLHEPSRHPQWHQEFSVQSLYKGHARAMLKSTCALMGRDFTSDYQRLGQLNKPIQLLWGKYDQTMPIILSQKMMSLIPNLDFHSIGNAAHLPNYEQPDEVNEKMITFLNKH
ncbi:MAG: alpha/beta hydrolase [Bermanella sp.]